MSIELYVKVPKGKAFRYELYTPPVVEEAAVPSAIANDEMTPGQITTMVGTMGICLIESIKRIQPDHSKLSREIKKAEEALMLLFRGTGQDIDNDTLEHTINVWNETMFRLSRQVINPKTDDVAALPEGWISDDPENTKEEEQEHGTIVVQV